jgi:hypothetical protein
VEVLDEAVSGRVDGTLHELDRFGDCFFVQPQRTKRNMLGQQVDGNTRTEANS